MIRRKRIREKGRHESHDVRVLSDFGIDRKRQRRKKWKKQKNEFQNFLSDSILSRSIFDELFKKRKRQTERKGMPV